MPNADLKIVTNRDRKTKNTKYTNTYKTKLKPVLANTNSKAVPLS